MSGLPAGVKISRPNVRAPCLCERPDDFAVLSTAVVGAYYVSPLVRETIGYPGQSPRSPVHRGHA